MSTQARIYSTKDYDKFHFILGNRKIQEKMVNTLMKDVTFPKKFMTSPIVVFEKTPLSGVYHVIDGQHRFTAASRLGIPIYYIIDETASVEDIAIRNSQMNRFKLEDFVNFRAKTGNESCKIIYELRQKHKVTFTLILSCLSIICSMAKRDLNEKIKNGKIDIKPYKDDLDEFIEKYNVMLYSLRQFKSEHIRPLMTEHYVKSFALLFRDDKPVFEKIMKRLPLIRGDVPYVGDMEAAKKNINIMCRSRFK